MEIYAAADKSWMQSAGSFAGYWKFNPDLAIGAGLPLGGATPSAAQVATAIYGYNPRFGDVNALLSNQNAITSAGASFAVPLSIMSGLFRSRNYLPISQMGEMVLQFTLASAAEACVQTTTSDAFYSLSNIFIELDVVQPHYLYAELLNKVTQSDGEAGLVIPYEAAVSNQGQAIGPGPSSVIVSRATNNLRRIVYANQLTAGLSSSQYPSVSTFPNATLSSWQARCGSLYFPSQPADTLARLFYLTQTAYGAAVNTKPGIMNRRTFANTTVNGAAWTPAGLLSYSDACVIAYCFDNYKNTAGTNVLDADGLSVNLAAAAA